MKVMSKEVNVGGQMVIMISYDLGSTWRWARHGGKELERFRRIGRAISNFRGDEAFEAHLFRMNANGSESVGTQTGGDSIHHHGGMLGSRSKGSKPRAFQRQRSATNRAVAGFKRRGLPLDPRTVH